MKKLLSLSLAMLLVFSLAACGETTDTDVTDPDDNNDNPGNVTEVDDTVTLEDLTTAAPLEGSKNYRTTYAAHYETLNYLVSQSAGDNEYTANMIDGLVEVNRFNQIVGAMATEWSSEIVDGKEVWTFKIREGVYWQDNKTLEPYAEVTAQDWVTSAQYILEPVYNSELISLLTTFIDGGENYYCSKQAMIAEQNGSEAPVCTEEEGYEYNTDFSQVGVKAIDKYTLQYTLTNPAPYFITVLTYNSYYPANVDYILSVGDDFGIDSSKILINGAYNMDEDILDAKILLQRNPYYWDAEHVYVEELEWIYAGGDLGTEFYRKLYEAGEIDGFRLKEDDISGVDYYVYGPDGTGTYADPYRPEAVVRGTVSPYTYHHIWNYGRESYVGSDLTQEQHDATQEAIYNANFRLGFMHGYDRTQILGIWTPDNPYQWMRNTYTPRELATDSQGRDYVEYVYDVISEKQGIPRDEVNGMYEDGNDALYDYDKALDHFEAAKEELLAAGLSESDFPIQVEMVTTYNQVRIPFYEALRDKFNAEFGEYMELVLVIPANSDEYSEWKSTNKSYDIWDLMGWGPDYQDPKTYLNTYAINGDMIAYAGLGSHELDIQEKVLGEYDEMYRKAAAYTAIEDTDKRMRAFAEAEYKLVFEDAIIYPYLSPRGEDIYISKVKPFTRNSVTYGSGQYRYKGMIVLEEPITAEERAELEAELEAARSAQ